MAGMVRCGDDERSPVEIAADARKASEAKDRKIAELEAKARELETENADLKARLKAVQDFAKGEAKKTKGSPGSPRASF